MAEEFYAAAAGIYGGNWWCSPRSSMFHGIGMFSPCFLDVPGDKPGRNCDDDYGGSNSSGFSACGSDFITTDVETRFSPSALSDLNRTLFGDDEKVAEIYSYASILNEFSGEDSSAFLQNYLYGNSELYVTGGVSVGSFNNQNHLATSSEDHSSNLDQQSPPPSLPKSTSSSKPSAIKHLRSTNKSSTMDSTVESPARQLHNIFDYPIPGTKIKSNTMDAKTTIKRSNNMVESSGMKRQRIETPYPLPTFKVRKEKLGDRITTLQQLVSPFGKTDTASVLHEAIEYIKFLHDQVNALSTTPYMKNGRAHHVRPREPELRSRGLCVVPISSAFPVPGETLVDFWTPNLGGTFR